jgi:tetratricopeptide (TPR) repeat protein
VRGTADSTASLGDIAPAQVGAVFSPAAGYTVTVTTSFTAPDHSRATSPSIAISGHSHQPPFDNPASATERAEALYRAGDYSKAAELLSPLASAEPPNPTATRLLGLCRLKLGDPNAALGLLQRAKMLAPDDPWADLHLGFGLHALGRHAGAVDLFRACEPRLSGDPAPSLNLAASLLALGDNRDAVEAAGRAVQRAPNLPQAHYMLGMAQAANGEFEAAEAAYGVALRLNPKFADALVNLGLVRYRRNDIEGARAAMTQALTIDPTHRAAAANFAVFERLTGDAATGDAVLRGALANDPAAYEARLNLAVNLIHEERSAEGLEALDAVPLPSEPRLNGHWRAQRALALIQLGRRTEARGMLLALGDGTPDLAPLLQWRWLLLALAEGDVEQARTRAARMESALQNAAAPLPEHRIMAHFDLAKFWSAQRDPDRAFPFWVDGHRLLGRFQPFSRDQRQQTIDATMANFTGDRLRAGPRAANRDQAPVFIVGMPRSCTTLTEQIIAAHPAAFGAGERLALGKAYVTLGGGNYGAGNAGRIAALGQHELDRAAADYLADLHALAPDAARVIDKMPGNFDHLGLVATMLPRARIIYCARDPRDIGLSIFTYRFYGHHPYAHDLSDLGWYIGRHHQLMAHWRSVLPNPMLTVQLSDWVDDFAGTLRKVLDFLDLPYDPACERFYEQDREVLTVSRAQVRQPVNARGIGRWRAYERHLQPMFAELRAAGIMPGDEIDLGREISIANELRGG